MKAVLLPALAALALAGCAADGDPRFPRLPDAAAPDALVVTPDAAIPADAPPDAN